MLQSIRPMYVLLCFSFLILASEAQFFDESSASLGGASVGFISRSGVFGDRENIASFGNSPVGVYQRRQYPFQTWYQAPVVELYPPAGPQMLLPVNTGCRSPGPCYERVVKPVRQPPARPPMPHVRPPPARPPKSHVRPPPKPAPVKPPCKLPGPCSGQVGKPVRPVQPAPPYSYNKPAVRPGVRPPKIPAPYNTTRPKTNKPNYKPGSVGGRTLSGLLGMLG